MTTTMMMKVTEAKAMVAHFVKDGKFIPAQYEEMRYDWNNATPTWATLKKYADEIGLRSEEVAYEWHCDGSPLATLAMLEGLHEGTVCYYTQYYFE